MINSFRDLKLAFRKISASLFNFNQENRDGWVAAIASTIGNDQHVLDVGAGTGRYRTLFKHCDYRAHDFGALPDTETNYTKLDYISDITSIPVESNSFDVIICTEVLEHVPEPIKAVFEIARILKPGGLLLLTTPLGSFLHQQPYHFYGGFTPHWFYKYLPDAGLEVVAIQANGAFFSYFGQEARRFSAFLVPRCDRGLKLFWLVPIWIVTLPFCRVIFPWLGKRLDSLRLEDIATVGYHVKAIKPRV